MKKLFLFLLTFSLLVTSFTATAPLTLAASCKLSFDPAKITTDDTLIKSLTITENGLDQSKPYVIKFSGLFGTQNIITDQKFTDGKIVLSNVSSLGISSSSTGSTGGPGNPRDVHATVYDPTKETSTFSPGEYAIEVIDRGASFDQGYLHGLFGATETQKCKATFSVEQGAGNKCQMIFPSPDIKAGADIKMQLAGFGTTDDNYVTYVQKDTQTGKVALTSCHSAGEYSTDEGVSLGKLTENGVYFVTVWPAIGNQCAANSLYNPFTGTLIAAPASVGKHLACSGLIVVPGLAIGVGSPNSASLSGFLTNAGLITSPCHNSSTGDPHYTCPTAIGPIDTNAAAFAKQVFGILLSISGGIALLLIINAGYQIMTSEGNPEKLQAARETITSAVIGLVFSIFSLVILQIIGVEILRIPGFGK